MTLIRPAAALNRHFEETGQPEIRNGNAERVQTVDRSG